MNEYAVQEDNYGTYKLKYYSNLFESDITVILNEIQYEIQLPERAPLLSVTGSFIKSVVLELKLPGSSKDLELMPAVKSNLLRHLSDELEVAIAKTE